VEKPKRKALIHNRQGGPSVELEAAGGSVQTAAGHVSFECRLIIDFPHIDHTIHRTDALLCHTPLISPLEPSSDVTKFMIS
jgi:hypothetical protein